MSDKARFLAKVRVDNFGCWEWLGSKAPNGYTRFWWNGRKGLAHRFAYETFIGPIPEGLEIDHKCRNRGCVNPDHLDLVTRSENTRRGLAGIKRAHCKRGHPFNETNTYIDPRGRRSCRLCHNQSSYRFIRQHSSRYAAYQRKYRDLKRKEV